MFHGRDLPPPPGGGMGRPGIGRADNLKFDRLDLLVRMFNLLINPSYTLAEKFDILHP